jgi:hypothetical protein
MDRHETPPRRRARLSRSSGPIVTPQTASVWIPFHMLEATSPRYAIGMRGPAVSGGRRGRSDEEARRGHGPKLH